MAGKLLLGAASIAFVAVAGAAQAADVQPVVVPVIVPVPVVSTGPDIEITLEAIAGVLYAGTPEFVTAIGGDVIVTSQSGWGIGIGGYAEFYFPGTSAGIGARLFREMGNLQIGVITGIDIGMGTEYYVGTDIRYETDTIEALNQTFAVFDGGFDYWGNYLEVTFTPSDRLEVYQELTVIVDGGVGLYAEGDIDVGIRGPVRLIAGYDLTYTPGPQFVGVYGGVQLDLNGIKPYVTGFWTNDGGPFYGVNLGVEIERELGDGPFTLIGGTDLTLSNGGRAFEAAIGIRFELGGDD